MHHRCHIRMLGSAEYVAELGVIQQSVLARLVLHMAEDQEIGLGIYRIMKGNGLDVIVVTTTTATSRVTTTTTARVHHVERVFFAADYRLVTPAHRQVARRRRVPGLDVDVGRRLVHKYLIASFLFQRFFYSFDD